ncbi:MAG: hypothetical protein F7B17_04460 [Desulfurococcales archaeon]|nr:hypothetical protein [Desulfurococcales archaeon]
MEPTQRAGGCLSELLPLGDVEVSMIAGILQSKEHDLIAVLLAVVDDKEVYAVVEYTDECPALRELRVRGCGEARELIGAADWPEVSEVVIEGRCAEIVIPGDTRVRVENALKKLGVSKLEFLAWRPWSEGA